VYNKLYNAGRAGRLIFVIWYLHTVHDRERDPTLLQLNGKLWYQLHGYVKYQAIFFPMFIHEVSIT